MRDLISLYAAVAAIHLRLIAGEIRLRTLFTDRLEDPLPNALDSVGLDGEPEEVYPLGLCQGDCQRDEDCDSGLTCFLDANYETVPGCVGVRRVTSSGVKECYCFQQGTSVPVAVPIPRPTPQPHSTDAVCELAPGLVIAETSMELQNRIYDIQGNETTSSYLNSTVLRVEGIVTAIYGNRFFMQDTEGDGDPATSDAIEVESNNDPSNPILAVFQAQITELQIGDIIVVRTATIEEDYPPGPAFSQPTTLMRVDGLETFVQSRFNALPEPEIIGLEGLVPPNSSMVEGIAFWESLEGMLVEIISPGGISPTMGNSVYVVSEFGANSSGLSLRSTLNLGPEDFNPESILIVEKGIFDVSFPENENVGAVYRDIVGVVGYYNGQYAVYPTEQFGTLEQSPLNGSSIKCEESPIIMSTGTYNLGGSNNYETIAKHLVNNMGFPDVVALQGIPKDMDLATLVESVEQVEEGATHRYRFITDFGQDELAVLYNAWRVSQYITNTTSGGVPAHLAVKLKYLPTEELFDLINVRFTNKTGSAAIMGVNQPFEDLVNTPIINAGVQERLVESNNVRSLIEDGDSKFVTNSSKVIVLGTMNDNEFVSPLVNLEGTPLKNVVEQVPENERYSVIDFGSSQAWDHIFVSKFFCEGASAGFAHVNAEFSDGISDHDPMVACLRIPNEES